MAKRGLTTVEIVLAAFLVLLLGGLSIWAAVDGARRSRDTVRVADIRDVQAALAAYRAQHASYPAAIEDLGTLKGIRTAFAYQARPQGCAPDQAQVCDSYSLAFKLEGPVGFLKGGACQASPDGLTCG